MPRSSETRWLAPGTRSIPEYGLASNKGYSTPKHLKMLRERGPTPLHRLSFAPVWTSSAPQEVLEFMLEEKLEADEPQSTGSEEAQL